MSAIDTQLPTGSHLAHYEIIRLMAKGGMGSVYLAYEEALHRYVAIKVLEKGVKESQERFEKEARALASMRHPNIMPVHFIGNEGGFSFFVMPYIQGGNLGDWIKEKRYISPKEAFSFMSQAVQALSFAYRKGLLHLDIKPQNFLVDLDGTILLTDFGLVQRLDETIDTNRKILLATPHYVAPEQLDSSPVDIRTDIYSLGAALFHLCFGSPICTGQTADELLEQHRTRIFPVKEARELKIGEGWISLMKGMTEPSPADRFQNYKELYTALVALECKDAEDTTRSPHLNPPPVEVRSFRNWARTTLTFALKANSDSKVPPPEVARVDNFQEANEHVLKQDQQTTILVVFRSKKDEISQNKLEEILLPILRNRDEILQIKLAHSNLCVLLTNASPEGAAGFCRRIKNHLKEAHPTSLEWLTFEIFTPQDPAFLMKWRRFLEQTI